MSVNEDYKALNSISVPLADLRMKIIDLMKQNVQEVPLADLLLIIKDMIDKKKEE